MSKTKTITVEKTAADDASALAPAKKINTVVALMKRIEGATLPSTARPTDPGFLSQSSLNRAVIPQPAVPE